MTKHKLYTWEIVLLALGSPIWGSLIIVAAVVLLSLYVSLWAAIISIWAVFGSLIASTFGAILGGAVLACFSSVASGIAMICAGVVCAGLSIFSFFGCMAATKGMVRLTKWMFEIIKKCFSKKEGAK